MNCKGTGKTAMLLGTMPGETTLESVYEQIQTGEAQTDAVDVEIINSDQDATYLAVLCLKADAGAVEEGLKGLAGICKSLRRPVHAVPAKETAELKRN